MTTKADYMKIIIQAYQNEKDRQAEETTQSLKAVLNQTPLFGYAPPAGRLQFASVCAFLFAQREIASQSALAMTGGGIASPADAEHRPALATTSSEQLLEQALQGLMFYREWTYHLPERAVQERPEYEERGIPPIEPVFQPILYVPAVQNIRPALQPGQLEALVDIVADGLRPIWRFPEWGGHNRAMLRAAGLALAAQAFPDHAEAGQWANLADELAEESWGRWSVEDAMLYQPHWLRALFQYAAARGKLVQLRDFIQTRLHLKAMTQLISPLDVLPDYGDSHWLMHSQWEWMACLEWGAAAYRDPAMKWTAGRLYAGRLAETPNAYFATVAALAYQWCEDAIEPQPPANQDEALDDLVLKKLVWRTGWDAQATYACLNYRDEGDYGRVARDYLRATLAVSAEKMHHGHADEGSFSMLVHNGTLLLHESGYRESPPDGIYRDRVYHNRLVWRAGWRPEGVGLLEFLRGDGCYQPVRTERLYHTHLGPATYDRVRVTDERAGLVWDRSVIFIAELPGWLVVDGLLATRSERRTVSAVWWSTDVLRQAERGWETYLRGVQGWQNRTEAVLWIGAPATPGQGGVLTATPFRRSFQDEIALTHTWSSELPVGHYLNFVSLLWPHAFTDLNPARAQALEVIASDPVEQGIGLRFRWQGKEWLFGVLNDLAAGVSPENVRPTYTALRGLTGYGDLVSDAAFTAAWDEGEGRKAGFINGTYLAYHDKQLFHSPLNAMFMEDRTARPGRPARFRWEGKI